MRHFAVVFALLATTVALGACGDAGDHFLDFHQNPPGPTIVNRIAAVMPIVPSNYSGKGTYALHVTVYSGGNAIPQGTVLNNPVLVSSNYAHNVTFDGSHKSQVSFGRAPGTITVDYLPPPQGHRCNPPIGIVAFNKDADPQTQEVTLVQCGTPSPSTSPSTSPTGPPKTVASMAISLSATPDPSSSATLTLTVSLDTADGKPIATGTPLAQRLVLQSNSPCNVTFTYGAATGSSLPFSFAPGSVTVNYTPPGPSCVAPPAIVIQAYDKSANPQSVSTSFAAVRRAAVTEKTAGISGARTVASTAISLSAPPNLSNPATLTMTVRLYAANRKPISPGTSLTQPLVLRSSSTCNITFTYGASTNSSLSFSFAPGSVSVNYTPPSSTCGAPDSIVIQAFVDSAKPKTVSTSFAVQSTVATMKLSMVATPNPASEGVYPMTISARDAAGKPIAPGTLLTNAIALSSNATCTTQFQNSYGGAAAPRLTLSTLSQAFLIFNPSGATAGCPAPAKVTVSAAAGGASTATFTFDAPGSTTSTLKVAKILLSAASTPNPQSGGTFELIISARSSSRAIPVGAQFAQPIQLTSNATCNIAFKSASGNSDSLALTSNPGTVTVAYTGSQGGCTAPSQILITAFDLTAKPQAASLAVLGGSAVVTSIKLTMLSPPDSKSAGIYPFYVTGLHSGKAIPFGQSYTYPIQLSSNASCVVTFGSSPTGSFETTDTIANTTTQVYMEFNPGAASAGCPSPGVVKITAIGQGSTPATYTFVNANPVY